ncbi:HNH endonuclease [Nocardiopsis sp. NPDC006938]|uniref:HNH endonuclease n=1 Tax=Nocardiopsis sp. NPDC006938 TaxID=3364337 RepID=UPI0036849A5B
MTLEELTEAIFGDLDRETLTPIHLVDEEEFLSKIPGYDPDVDGLGLDATQCWELRNRVCPANGYPYIKVKGENWNAARISFEMFVGPLGRDEEGRSMEPDHLCGNTRCVNIYHLERVSKRENVLRSNNPCAQNARKTECIRGHAFDEDNTYLRPNGGRTCRECIRMRRAGEI